MKKTHSCHH